MSSTPNNPAAPKDNFLQELIRGDILAGRHKTSVTRFPPEPNGFLHIGHAKSICLNFGLAETFGGRCHLRFDDTNPTTEDVAYVDAIKRDIKWLGFDWHEHLYFASDYFEQLYEKAQLLIKKGKAYVDSLSEEDVRTYRGTITEAGKLSPFASRTVEENLDLLSRMRAGEFDNGAHVVRARIDMANPNMKMRDPLLYRIKRHHHYRTGDAWCIYPLYDFAHCLSDAFEGITHSICTLEFENNRELYDWIVRECEVEHTPRQYEFARLKMSYTLTSKRKLLKLVQDGSVDGWDDPRMPTVAGMRRLGVTASALRAFCDMIGVAKNNSTVDVGKFEYCLRDDLNHRSPRLMAVLSPLSVVIDNLPEGETSWIDAPLFPPDIGKPGTRSLPLSREIMIESTDFLERPPKGFYRLSPDSVVRLRHGPVIRCEQVERDSNGNVTRLRCIALSDEESKQMRVKGTIHWVSKAHAVTAKVRLYDRLFSAETPVDLADLNPTSLTVIEECLIEPFAATPELSPYVQFERNGYFCADSELSRPDSLVFNRTVTLRDSWAPSRQTRRTRSKALKQTMAEVPDGKRARSSQAQARSPERTEDQQLVMQRLVGEGVDNKSADRLARDPNLRDWFEKARIEHPDAAEAAKWTVNDVAAILKADPQPPFGPQDVGRLLAAVAGGELKRAQAKAVLGSLATTGGPLEDRLAEVQTTSADAVPLADVIGQVLALHPAELERYRGGKTALMGFFVGQVMRATKGSADADAVKEALSAQLNG